MNWSSLPKTDPKASTCVRWNPKTKRYELVVGGVVTASISRLRMSMRSEAAQFRALVAATASVVKRKKAERDAVCE